MEIENELSADMHTYKYTCITNIHKCKHFAQIFVSLNKWQTNWFEHESWKATAAGSDAGSDVNAADMQQCGALAKS